MMLDAIKAWPEFHLFTAGYVMSRLPADSLRFKEGLEWEWRNLDVCSGERIDRMNPDYNTYIALETTEGAKRVCWNSGGSTVTTGCRPDQTIARIRWKAPRGRCPM